MAVFVVYYMAVSFFHTNEKVASVKVNGQQTLIAYASKCGATEDTAQLNACASEKTAR
jgi:hypothetical protein